VLCVGELAIPLVIPGSLGRRQSPVLAKCYLGKHPKNCASPVLRQRRPNQRTGLGHDVILATEPAREAPHGPVSAAPASRLYFQRHHEWDIENAFDELKNQWGWGGFTTQDLKRCRLLAGVVALVYNWWSLFVRLADPDHHREAITTRPLLLTAIARQTQHAGQVKLTITSTHARQHWARQAYVRIARFLAELRNGAEQLNPLQRWYRILSEALRYFLKGRQLEPPLRLKAT
jgi:hypothetical protein